MISFLVGLIALSVVSTTSVSGISAIDTFAGDTLSVEYNDVTYEVPSSYLVTEEGYFTNIGDFVYFNIEDIGNPVDQDSYVYAQDYYEDEYGIATTYAYSTVKGIRGYLLVFEETANTYVFCFDVDTDVYAVSYKNKNLTVPFNGITELVKILDTIEITKQEEVSIEDGTILEGSDYIATVLSAVKTDKNFIVEIGYKGNLDSYKSVILTDSSGVMVPLVSVLNGDELENAYIYTFNIEDIQGIVTMYIDDVKLQDFSIE